VTENIENFCELNKAKSNEEMNSHLHAQVTNQPASIRLIQYSLFGCENKCSRYSPLLKYCSKYYSYSTSAIGFSKKKKSGIFTQQSVRAFLLHPKIKNFFKIFRYIESCGIYI